MIEPVGKSPLNTTNKLRIKCEHCPFDEVVTLSGSFPIANIDDKGKIEETCLKEFECPTCGKVIKEN